MASKRVPVPPAGGPWWRVIGKRPGRDGRALLACPTLLMLDDPSLGLTPLFAHDMLSAIRDINAQGTSALPVKQNVVKATQLAKGAYVIGVGRIVAQGLASEPIRGGTEQHTAACTLIPPRCRSFDIGEVLTAGVDAATHPVLQARGMRYRPQSLLPSGSRK